MRLIDRFCPKPKHDPVPSALVIEQVMALPRRLRAAVIADRKAHVTRLMQRQNAKGLVAAIGERL